MPTSSVTESYQIQEKGCGHYWMENLVKYRIMACITLFTTLRQLSFFTRVF